MVTFIISAIFKSLHCVAVYNCNDQNNEKPTATVQRLAFVVINAFLFIARNGKNVVLLLCYFAFAAVYEDGNSDFCGVEDGENGIGDPVAGSHGGVLLAVI